MKFTKTYDVLELRFKESYRDGPGSNSHYSGGDDYGKQHDFSVKTAKEMLLFIKLKEKYDRDQEPLKLTRFTTETITAD